MCRLPGHLRILQVLATNSSCGTAYSHSTGAMSLWILAFALAVCGLTSPVTVTQAAETEGAPSARGRLLRSAAAAETLRADRYMRRSSGLLLRARSLEVSAELEGRATTGRLRTLLQDGGVCCQCMPAPELTMAPIHHIGLYVI